MRVRKDIDIVMEPEFGRYCIGEISWRTVRLKSLLAHKNDRFLEKRYKKQFLVSIKKALQEDRR